MNLNKETDSSCILEAGMTLGESREVRADSVPYIVIPESSKVVDLEFLLPYPERKKAIVKVNTIASLVDYVQMHREDGTQGFVDSGHIDVVIDYHGKTEGKPNWGHHRVQFRPQYSPEYMAWQAKDKVWIAQAEFAEFLQEHTAEIVAPDGATLLETARMLTASKQIVFRSGTSLRDGTTQFTYDESITATGGTKGTIDVPEMLTVRLMVIEGGVVMNVGVRLRFKIEDGKLRFRMDLVNMTQTLRLMRDMMIGEAEKALEMTFIRGTYQL